MLNLPFWKGPQGAPLSSQGPWRQVSSATFPTPSTTSICNLSSETTNVHTLSDEERHQQRANLLAMDICTFPEWMAPVLQLEKDGVGQHSTFLKIAREVVAPRLLELQAPEEHDRVTNLIELRGLEGIAPSRKLILRMLDLDRQSDIGMPIEGEKGRYLNAKHLRRCHIAIVGIFATMQEPNPSLARQYFKVYLTDREPLVRMRAQQIYADSYKLQCPALDEELLLGLRRPYCGIAKEDLVKYQVPKELITMICHKPKLEEELSKFMAQVIEKPIPSSFYVAASLVKMLGLGMNYYQRFIKLLADPKTHPDIIRSLKQVYR